MRNDDAGIEATEGASRRSFLLSSGGLITTAWLATNWASVKAAAHDAAMAGDMAAADVADAPAWNGFQFLKEAESRDVDALAAQIVPSGTTPGAREAHAVHFIDRALATFFASWGDDFRHGLGDFQAAFAAAHPGGGAFAAAGDEVQIDFLKTVDKTPFFGAARTLTLLGMFSSPKYGGNSDASGWKLMGFEDRHAFTPPFGYYDAKYTGFVPYPEKST